MVTIKTVLEVNTLYKVNPNEATIWPTKSHFDTPLLDLVVHCFLTCVIIVSSSTVELAQPTISVMIE